MPIVGMLEKNEKNFDMGRKILSFPTSFIGL